MSENEIMTLKASLRLINSYLRAIRYMLEQKDPDALVACCYVGDHIVSNANELQNRLLDLCNKQLDKEA